MELVLKLRMSKAPEVRRSKWSTPTLNEAQQEYAALDAILSLDVYVALEKLPDLAAKLTAEQAVAGTKAEVVPVRGSVGVLATRVAVVTISGTEGEWSSPEGCLPKKLKLTAQRRRVTVEKVLAPESGVLVPGLKEWRRGCQPIVVWVCTVRADAAAGCAGTSRAALRHLARDADDDSDGGAGEW